MVSGPGARAVGVYLTRVCRGALGNFKCQPVCQGRETGIIGDDASVVAECGPITGIFLASASFMRPSRVDHAGVRNYGCLSINALQNAGAGPSGTGRGGRRQAARPPRQRQGHRHVQQTATKALAQRLTQQAPNRKRLVRRPPVTPSANGNGSLNTNAPQEELPQECVNDSKVELSTAAVAASPATAAPANTAANRDDAAAPKTAASTRTAGGSASDGSSGSTNCGKSCCAAADAAALVVLTSVAATSASARLPTWKQAKPTDGCGCHVSKPAVSNSWFVNK